MVRATPIVGSVARNYQLSVPMAMALEERKGESRLARKSDNVRAAILVWLAVNHKLPATSRRTLDMANETNMKLATTEILRTLLDEIKATKPTVD